MKFKVTYYQDAKPIVKDVEATKMLTNVGENGALVVLFTDDDITDSPKIHSAFSSVISVEKIDGDER